jgi:hypothetical protein
MQETEIDILQDKQNKISEQNERLLKQCENIAKQIAKLENRLSNIGYRYSPKSGSDVLEQKVAKLASMAILGEPSPNALLNSFLGSFFKHISGFGGKAGGGQVSPSASYLVGEKGPEIFTPSNSGTVSPISKASNNLKIHININSPEHKITKSKGQLSADLLRAVNKASRYL